MAVSSPLKLEAPQSTQRPETWSRRFDRPRGGLGEQRARGGVGGGPGGRSSVLQAGSHFRRRPHSGNPSEKLGDTVSVHGDTHHHAAKGVARGLGR